MEDEPKLGYLDGDDREAEPLPDEAFMPPEPEPEANLDVVDLAKPPSPVPTAKVVDPDHYEGVAPEADAAPELARSAAATAVKTGASLGAIIAAIFVSLLPQRWRDRCRGTLPVVGGTLLSGIAQLSLGMLLYARGVMDTQVASVEQFTAQGKIPLFTTGLDAFVALLFSFYGLLCLYLFLEGVARTVGAAVLGVAHGTLPLWVTQEVIDLAGERITEARLGPRVADTVEIAGADCDLRIESSRPRNWDDDTTIEYDYVYYEVQERIVLDSGPRRFVFRMRRRPKHKVIRRLHRYAPDELLPIKHRGGNNAAQPGA